MRTNHRSTYTLPRPLHVILEHRNAEDFQCFLEYLEEQRQTNALPSKLNIFSDFQWLQTGRIISTSQRRELFQALSGVCGNLKRLQIDLLCDLISTDPAAELPELIVNDSSSSSHSSSGGDSEEDEDNFSLEYHDLVQRLQVLPCSLLTCLLKKAPQLESLSLKELFLAGSPSEVQDLVDTLQSHATLRSIDLRWKLAGSTAKNSAIINSLVAALIHMPHLQEVNLMIPHWCPYLMQLPQSLSFQTVKLTVETTPQQSDLAHWMKHWKSHPSLMHLEVSGFHVLQDSTAVLELLRNNTQLQKLVVIDHNVFARSTKQHPQPTRHKRLSKKNNNHKTNSFAHDLAQVLQSNTALQHLHLISRNPRRRGSLHESQREQQDYRVLLGNTMEHNFVLQHLELSHGGIQLSAPQKQQQHHHHHKDSPFLLGRHATMMEDSLDLYLRMNRDGYRRELLGSDDPHKWNEALQYYQKDTASVYVLLQTAPSVMESWKV